MSECIDLSEVYPLNRAPVCDRGLYGCPVVHLRPMRRAIEGEVEPSPPPPPVRWSTDFPGCVE